MSEDEAMKMFTARQPTGRFCSKEEVANLALYLGKTNNSLPITDMINPNKIGFKYGFFLYGCSAGIFIGHRL